MGADTLFRSHAAFVASFLARLGIAEVEDAVQEVFLIAHRRGGFVEAAARPTTWLAEIALRVAQTSRRTAGRRSVVLDPTVVEHTVELAPTPEDAASTRQSLERVQQALESLELEDRALFVLFELQGESCESIGKGLGIPIGTVYSRLFTARSAFQKAHERVSRSQRRLAGESS